MVARSGGVEWLAMATNDDAKIVCLSHRPKGKTRSLVGDKMRYGYDIPRRGVVLSDVPFTWNTNMEDSDLLDFYLLIRNDPDIMATPTEINVMDMMSIAIRVFDKFVEFKDGACHCIGGVNDTIYAIYKTTPEWKVWGAHRQEIEELREEQDRERQVEQVIVWVEIHHLTDKCTENLNSQNYDEAFRCLCGQVDLMRNNKIWWDRAEESMRLCGFPLDFCIRYLNQYARSSDQYFELADALAFRKRAISAEDADALFQSAVARFPDDGRLFKSICLFWERRQDYHHALRYCTIALLRNLTDDTKGGFATRMKRLKKKAEQRAAQLPLAPQTGAE